MTALSKSLGEVLLHWEAVQSDKVFLFAPEISAGLTYGQLAKEARHFSTWLEQEQISAQGHVGLFMQNGRQTSTVFLATMACGRVITPLNLLAPTDQLAWVLDHSDIEVLFYSPDKKAGLLLALEKTKRKFKVFELDPDAAEGPFMQCAPGTLPSVQSSQAALLMYTSGTTGTPKGVLLTHANLLHAARSMAAWHSLTQSDTVLSSLPIYHINGQVISTITPFVSGGSVVAPHAFSVSSWWGLAIQYRCTWINMVPTIIAYLINAAKSGGVLPSHEDLKSIRFGRSASVFAPRASS